MFEHHGEALMAGDIDGLVSGYADDVLFITSTGVLLERTDSAKDS